VTPAKVGDSGVGILAPSDLTLSIPTAPSADLCEQAAHCWACGVLH
jgi:hypothetical protein